MNSKKRSDKIKSMHIDYDNIETGYYDSVYRKNKGVQSKWHHLKFKGIHNILSSIEYDSLLDIACGPGTFIGTLPETKKCMGFDISGKQILYAQNHYGYQNHKFLTASAENFPFDNNSFQVITAIEFIEHISIESTKKMFSEALRCLTPKGYFLLTTPNYEILWPILELLVCRLSKVDYRSQHISKFNIEKLLLLLEDSGFRVILIRKYLNLSPFFALLNQNLANNIFDLEFDRFTNRGNLLLAFLQKLY